MELACINSNNHITTAPFAYDAAGNLTADAAGTYTWNAEGELHTAGGVTNTYDGDGRRVQKSNGKLYWYGGGNVIEESDAAGTMQESYVFFDGKRIANRAVSSGAISYYAEDFIGSSRVITTSAGATCYDADFYPYGAESNVTNTCSQNYKWTGKERDAETGNDNFDARYYSSTYGRFLSADWSAVPAPVPYANLTNPQTLNLYAIVRDNPESFADLYGHIIDDSGLNDNKKYQAWKKEYLSHSGAAAQWNALNDNKNLTVHVGWDPKSMASTTGDFKFNAAGSLTEATVTLAAKTGDSNNHMSADAGYVHGSTSTDSKLQGAYVVAHEFAHVEQAEAPGGRQMIEQRNADGEFTRQKFSEMGIQNALRDPAVAAANQRLLDTSHQLESGADQRAWDIVGQK